MPVRAREGGEREGLEVDLGMGEREGEEGADFGSGGRANSGGGGVAALARARGEGEREELLVDLWRGGERRGGYLTGFFFVCRVS